MIIAIDGPAGTGKSTIAALLAKKFGFLYLNSGSFYRALTLAMNEGGIDWQNEKTAVEFCRAQKIDYVNSHLILNGKDVESRLHEDSITKNVAQVSANIEIRHLVNALMQKITEKNSIVCEGRDMTTVVFPNAEYKFFLDASLEVQAERRFRQGVSNLSLEQIKESIKQRDEIDKTKTEGALKKAENAIYIDTSHLTINEVCDKIISKINLAGFGMEKTDVEFEEVGANKNDENLQTQLMEESLKGLKTLEDGQFVEGTVVSVTDDLVFIDVGYKSEGKVPILEFAGEIPKIGDVVTVMIVKKDAPHGIEISKTKADAKRLLKEFQKSFEEKSPVEGTIEREVRGGFEVGFAGEIKAFLPMSQANYQKIEDPKKLLGLKEFFLIEKLSLHDDKANVVVNRRKLQEAKIEEARENFFANTQIGDTVKGVVKSFTSFGAFVDLGYFDGLLHINDMSWGHVMRPKDFVKKGQEIELKVIRLDPVEKRINLSLKHFTEDPWIHFEEKYHVDDIVEGKVTKLTDFGAFIELEEGIEGLAHISEFSWTKMIKKSSDFLKIGETIKCMILGYDIQAGRVSLGLKQAQENPWDTISQKHSVGEKIHGKIVRVTNIGVFVEIEEGVDGFLHLNDMSWTKKIRRPDKEFKVNDELDVMILSIDAERHRISLGLKQLSGNPWKEFAEKHKPGSTLEAEIVSITDFGIFMRTEEGLEGLVNKSNVFESRETPYSAVSEKYKVGDKVNVFVIDVNPEKSKAAFSIREFKKRQEMDEIKQYMSYDDNSDDEAFTIGDLMKAQQ